DPELADRAVVLLGVQVQDHPVAVALQRSVEVAPKHLAVQESNRDFARRSLGGQLRVARQLDPLDRGQRDPGCLVVLQPSSVVDLDQEVWLVEVEIARHPFQGLIVEKAHDYLGHVITYCTNPGLSTLLRTRRRPSRRAHLMQSVMWLRTASACGRLSLPARYGASSGTASAWLSSPSPSAAMYSSLKRRRAR